MKELEKSQYIISEPDACTEVSDPAVISKYPLVSVPMITYNHGQYIAQAIEGVIKQETSFPFELVIGEDCSTDSTKEIVLNFQKKYPDLIRVITSDNNVGGKKNSIRTFKACRGKYIAVCEGDDYWHHSQKLQKQVDYLESHPTCGMVYSSYDVYHVRSKKRIEDLIKRRKWKMPETPDVYSYIENEGGWSLGILTCTVMFKRALFEQVVESDPYLHQSGYFLLGDTQLWADLINIAPVHYIPESLVTYNYTEESATRSKDIKKRLKFQISSAEVMLYLCDKYKIPHQIRNNYEASFWDASLRLAFHSRNIELAEEIRRKKNVYSLKDWLRYYGAKYFVFYYPISIAHSFIYLFKRERNLMLE